MSEKEFKELSRDQRVELLRGCRSARALVLRDSESFDAACRFLEYAGQVAKRAVGNGLGSYEEAIIWLALDPDLEGSDQATQRDGIRRLFTVIREARNNAIHDGAWARHLSSRLIELLLAMEETLVKPLPTVGDLMVRDPVTVEGWQLLHHARRMMLENAFSYLPTCNDQREWALISDHDL